MSAIIYERFVALRNPRPHLSPQTPSLTVPFHVLTSVSDTGLLAYATDLYDSAVIKMIRDTGRTPPGPFLARDPRFQALKYTIVKCLFGADRRVVAQAKLWDMKFMSVSNLNGQTGPCGGLFWSEAPSAPFIVAAFKGTSPTSNRPFAPFFGSGIDVGGDYSEYVVDASFAKCDAGAYLHGEAHQGFFHSLFLTFSRLGLRLSPHGVPLPLSQ